jgi:hypothetical protein
MSDPVDDLPREIQGHIRRLLRRVAGGAERLKKSGDRGGLEAQKEISKALQDAGVFKSDPRWRATIDYGRKLYYGRATLEVAKGAPTTTRAPSDDGPIYTQGSAFRARAEAAARAFRVNDLRVGHAKYGHILGDGAREDGANFLHPAALAVARTRAARGKGVDRDRTFGNMLSSQALCFNLFGPLAIEPGGMEIAREVLAPYVPGLARVHTIEIEYTPPFEIFRDQRGRAGVDCDALLEFEDSDGQRGVLVVEVKFVEESFSRCGHRSPDSADPCPEDVVIGKDFGGCRYARKNDFAYWQRTAEAGSLGLSFIEQPGCPMAGVSWQVWVNHTLAHAEATRRNARRAVFAVCGPNDNEALQASSTIERYKQLTTDAATVTFIPLEGLLERLVEIGSRHESWSSWAVALRKRYGTTPIESRPGAEQQGAPETSAITPRHRHVVTWMSTPEFRRLVDVHAAALGDRMTVYFRPTDRGLVRIALHPDAARYVGFRSQAEGSEHLYVPGAELPTIEEIGGVLRAFESWLPGAASLDEERGVIGLLRRALTNDLWLPEMGEGWVFLHHEWRFNRSAGGKKADVLAVEIATGQLGIVEFKSSESALAEARGQVEEYAELWERDAAELAPFFTTLIRSLGLAYGNELAARATVNAGPATLFVGVASGSNPIRIRRHSGCRRPTGG